MSFFFVSSSFATTTTPKINVDYLNSLTGPKVTWETATESDSDIVLINGAYYKYTYNKPDDYTETSTKPSSYTNVNNIVFNNVAPTISGNGSVYGTIINNSRPSDKLVNFDLINSTWGSGLSVNGGAIYNTSEMQNINVSFINNTIEARNSGGGNIDNSGTIQNINGNFINNRINTGPQGGIRGGVIYNNRSINNIEGTFFNNSITKNSGMGGYIMDYAKGGAIYNSGTISLTNSSFFSNYIKTDDTNKSNAQGGAIYNEGTLNISANDGKQSIFSGNKIIYKNSSGNYVEESNAIHMAGGTLNLNSTYNGLIQFNDGISGSNYTINIDGDDTGRIELNNKISGLSSMDITGSNVYFGENSYINYIINNTGGSIHNAKIENGGVLNITSGGSSVGTRINSGGTLNLSAVDGGQIIFDDKITASTGSENTALEINSISYNRASETSALFIGEKYFLSPDQYENGINSYLDEYVNQALNDWGVSIPEICFYLMRKIPTGLCPNYSACQTERSQR